MKQISIFFIKCPAYKEIRNKYLNKFWITLNNVSVKDLVANDNPDIVRNTAVYIFLCTPTQREALEKEGK